ncbi:MAG: RluA family pseudouridine synthase [Candidatus Pacebacteria bacterium]|nr:RluA family pseudouridine synthase [Candidatus Paceibacterota bacterium]
MKIIYQDENILVINKPAGINSDDFERRIHRLDKDTSGILLIAKNNKALKFLQKQFQERKVEKKYILLVSGNVKNNKGTIKALLGRSPKDRRKQKVFSIHHPQAKGKRDSLTEYAVLKRFKDFTLIEATPKTGRKHQLRVHFAELSHPIAGDEIYSFKNQLIPEGLKRQFLHASYLKIKMPDEEIREFKSNLPKELKEILNNLN